MVVVGFSAGVGSGWNGAFDDALDNITYRTSGTEIARTFNLEVAGVSTVPEPSTYALMAAGLAKHAEFFRSICLDRAFGPTT